MPFSQIRYQVFHNWRLETGYVQKFITDYSQLSNSGKTIILIWIPSHIGIRGNEHTDEAANQPLIWVCQLWNALLLTCILRWLITVSVSGRPNGTDVSQTNYTLSNLSSAIVIWVVSVVKMLSFSGDSVSVILALPIHICWIDDQPECSHCDCALTVAHVLLECNCVTTLTW